MKNTIEGFNQSIICLLKFTWADAGLLRWLISFSCYSKIDKIEKEDGTYFWIKYSKVMEDLPVLGIHNKVSMWSLFNKFCGEGKGEEKIFYPLKKIIVDRGGDNKTYFAFRRNVMAILESGGIKEDKKDMTLTRLFEMNPNYKTEEIYIAKQKSIRENKVKVEYKIHTEVSQILEKLLEIKLEDGRPVFGNKYKSDVPCYLKGINEFQYKLLSLYQGTFLRNRISEEFLGNKFIKNLLVDDWKEKIKMCKGSWEYIKELLLKATKNYSSWFSKNNEPQKKDWFKRDVNTWVYDERNTKSLLVACLDRPSDSLREMDADKIYKSIYDDTKEVFNTVIEKNKKWEAKNFWSKIKTMDEWYTEHFPLLDTISRNTMDAVGNWLQGGRKGCMEQFMKWLLLQKYIGGMVGLRPGHFGTGGKIWGMYLDDMKKEWGIKLDLKLPVEVLKQKVAKLGA